MYRADGEVPGAPGAKVEGNHEPLPASPVLLLVEVRRMADQSWFRHWAKESLLSDDLDALTDHEERVWWRLLSAASLAEPRWAIDVTPRLAAKCKSTPAKFTRAVQRFAELCMVDFDGPNRVAITHAEKWNEDKNDRPPSSEKEAVRERVRRYRERQTVVTSNDVVTTVGNVTGNDHKEEKRREKEEEPEREVEKNKSVTPSAAAKRRYITPEAEQILCSEFPDFDVGKAKDDYLNYAPNHKHIDQVKGLRNMLADPSRNFRFKRERTSDAANPFAKFG